MLVRIYKIIHNQSDIVYVGSTQNILRQRWQCHKSGYKKFLMDNKNEKSLYPYFNEHGIDNFKIILIEEVEVEDYKERLIKEQEWIDKLTCINKIRAYRTPEEAIEYKNQYVRTEKYRQSKKEQYGNNKETILKKL